MKPETLTKPIPVRKDIANFALLLYMMMRNLHKLNANEKLLLQHKMCKVFRMILVKPMPHSQYKN